MKKKLTTAILIFAAIAMTACTSGTGTGTGNAAATEASTEEEMSEEEKEAEEKRKAEEEAKRKEEEEKRKEEEAKKAAEEKRKAFWEEHAGFYPIETLLYEGQTLTGDQIASVGGSIYMVLAEDGTGWYVQQVDGDVIDNDDLTWDEEVLERTGISSDYYTWDGDSFTIENTGDTVMTFARSNDDIPERPAKTDSAAANTSGSPQSISFTSFGMLNMSVEDIEEVYIYPSGGKRGDEPINKEPMEMMKAQYFWNTEIGLTDTALFDVEMVNENGTYLFKDVELKPGYALTFSGMTESNMRVMTNSYDENGDVQIEEIYSGVKQ